MPTNEGSIHEKCYFLYIGIILGAGMSFFAGLFSGFYFSAVKTFDVFLFTVTWVVLSILIIFLIIMMIYHYINYKKGN